MKTCFVISPIGEDGSETRKASDELFDLIIQPALEIFDFKIVRGDKIFNTTAITEEIIKYVQSSELCIIDLTAHNPNVFYECGRRHETARPYIHMKRKGEKIPFDIAGIRTIDYDTSDARKTKESVDVLRNFIRELEQTGYGSQSSGFSLSSIGATLSRIERKLDLIADEGAGQAAPALNLTGNPARIFYDAYMAQNYTLALQALKRFMQINPDINLHLDMACMLVEAYEPTAIGIVREALDEDFDHLKTSGIAIALDALTHYYIAALTIKDEYDYLKEMVKKTMLREMSDKEKAALLNIQASIEYGMKDDLKALEFQKKTLELVPSEPAYVYNIATIYDALKWEDDLYKALNILLTIYKNKDLKTEKITTKYLEFAKTKFKQKGMDKQANEVDELLFQAQQAGLAPAAGMKALNTFG